MKSIFQFCTIIILLGIVHSACKESKPEGLISENKISLDKLTLIPKEIIEIPIDSISLNWSPHPVYFTNDTCELYIAANEFSNSIDFYDLDKRRLIKRTTFLRDGPTGILSTRVMYLKSLDSIYVFSDKELKIILTDFKGNVYKSYDVGKGVMANLLQPFTVLGQTAYFAYSAVGDNRARVGYKTMLKLDLRSGIAAPYGSQYPVVFGKYLYFNFLPYYTFGPDHKNVVVRYGSLPTVYNYDLTNDSTYVFTMRSSFQDKDIMPDEEAHEFMDMNKDFEEIEQHHYQGIYYDKYNHVYYSTFHQGMPVKDLDGNKNTLFDKQLSLIIFNENFEYCGEVALEKNTYFNNNFICTKKGLLVPMSHPKNPNNNENTLRFQVFALQKEN